MEDLRQAVKDIVLTKIDGYTREEAEYYFDNPQEYSCSSGCVSDLVYYNDTERFAREHHDEIIGLMKEYGVEPMRANDMAWFGFEATVPTLKEEILEEEYEGEE